MRALPNAAVAAAAERAGAIATDDDDDDENGTEALLPPYARAATEAAAGRALTRDDILILCGGTRNNGVTSHSPRWAQSSEANKLNELSSAREGAGGMRRAAVSVSPDDGKTPLTFDLQLATSRPYSLQLCKLQLRTCSTVRPAACSRWGPTPHTSSAFAF